MRYSLILLLLVYNIHAMSQTNNNYQRGYVILVSGDTLRGNVMDRDNSTFVGLLKKVKFKGDKTWKKKYKPEKLIGYKRGEDQFRTMWISTESQLLRQRYYSIPGAGEQYFVKVIYSGSLDLFHWEYMIEENSTIDYIPLIKRSDSNELVRTTQGILGLRRKRLAEYFMSCPAVSTAIISKTVTTTDQLIALYEDRCNK